MHEKLVIVPQQRTVFKKIMVLVWFLLTCLNLFFAIFVFPLFILPTMLFGFVWFWWNYRTDIEFEYVYFDGDIRIARIKDKRRRKNIVWATMEESVVAIAPKGDRSVYKYENDKSIPYRNIGSGIPGAKVYELIIKKEKGLIRYEFEPDQDMVEAIAARYPRGIVK